MPSELEVLRRRVVSVGGRVDDALGMAVHALLTGNRALANEAVLNDLPINRVIRALDDQCYQLLQGERLQADELRLVITTLRMNIAIERIGDYAVTVAREAEQLGQAPPQVLADRVREMTACSRKMLRASLKSWAEGDVAMARATRQVASEVDDLLDRAWHDMLEMGRDTALRDSFALLIVFSNLERVSDQARNICEEAVFATTGETKPPKRYRVMFVDEDHTLSRQAHDLAEALFPESGAYRSAGWEKDRAAIRQAVPRHHVLVSLSGDPRAQLDGVPFSTIVLEWKSASKGLEAEVRRLMRKLRGAGAR